MLIGNRYSDNKLYRGIKHYDHLPLTSGDLHEYADILQMKNAYFLNNLLGSGTLNEPEVSISSSGISMLSPSVVLIDGDISLVQADGVLVSTSEIASSNISNGLVCIVGWYQSLTANSTLRSYGGVRNSTIENDILDTDLSIQVSTRYQLRWDVVIINKSQYDSNNNITFNLLNRDATGATTTGSTQLTTSSKVGNVYVVTKPTSMTYAVSDLYLVPILQYTYTGSSITSAKSMKSLKPEGALGGLLKSNTEPIVDLEEGTIWYDTANNKFKIYIDSLGFVPIASDYTLIQYRNTVTLNTASTNANTQVNIGIEQYTGTDILQVVYEGVVLTESIHYTLHSDSKYITLLGFTTKVGDQITFIDTKLVDTSNINSITSEFTKHVNTIGDNAKKGHVNLSDTASDTYGMSSGIAATPKAVYESTIITDSVTNKRYRLKVTNGVLGITEVV